MGNVKLLHTKDAAEYLETCLPNSDDVVGKDNEF